MKFSDGGVVQAERWYVRMLLLLLLLCGGWESCKVQALECSGVCTNVTDLWYVVWSLLNIAPNTVTFLTFSQRQSCNKKLLKYESVLAFHSVCVRSVRCTIHLSSGAPTYVSLNVPCFASFDFTYEESLYKRNCFCSTFRNSGLIVRTKGNTVHTHPTYPIFV